ncbi:MAG: SUF system NifU family Fe-S cluster assembly protein [Xanthomonadaceae bacterium]|nr:SUF system NifU family Fe-S cluster assembly protein [Xanthomonadaceae bacterium]MDE1959134.1 SUF system NifU family Fe-S cluster assembly protein [Xanthomonadaceae bacterium]
MSAIGPYRDIVLDHHRAPRRLGRLAPPAQAAEGVNALCGDRLRIEVRVEQDRVTAYAFEGECCAIATATASLLGDLALGRGRDDLALLERGFATLIGGGIAEIAELGALNALSELARYPARRKCALLPFATLSAALRGESCATTELPA